MTPAGIKPNPVVDDGMKALTAACAEWAKRPEDVDPTSTGCLQPVWVRDGDLAMQYSYALTILATGSLQITWPAGREVQVTWVLHRRDRWRLTAIDYVAN